MCGLVGITDHRDAAQLAYLALYSQQHRGQESAGIVSHADDGIHLHRGMGLVTEVLTEQVMQTLPGRCALGQVRYSTAGGSRIENAQPLLLRSPRFTVAMAHNGNLTNAVALRRQLEDQGAVFHGTADSEVIIHLMARHSGPVLEALVAALAQLEGAFSLLFMVPGEGKKPRIVAVRDPWGFRPVVMGKLHGSIVFASETCALDMMNARFIRELEPGEMVVAEGDSFTASRVLEPRKPSACVFEHVYLARPDSRVFNVPVSKSRRDMGRELARQMKGVEADLVVPVPDSGVPAALGFAEESGIPFEMGFIRNHYSGRTFMKPNQIVREKSVRLKLQPVRELLEGKRIVLVDDSMVRGTTSRKIVRMLKKARVKAVHMAISSPPVIGPCFYGIDTPAENELIAARMTVAQIREFLHVDSLAFLERERMERAVAQGTGQGLCTACFTRDYPTLVQIGH